MLMVSWRVEESLVLLAAPARRVWFYRRKHLPEDCLLQCFWRTFPFPLEILFTFHLDIRFLIRRPPSLPHRMTRHMLWSWASATGHVRHDSDLYSLAPVRYVPFGDIRTRNIQYGSAGHFCLPWLKQTHGRIIMRTWVLRPTRNRRTLRSSSGN